MNTLLESLYHLLSFLTEDAQDNNIPGTSENYRSLHLAMNALMKELERYLDITTND